ncbi:hypothetical protein [Microseira wollei]|uniref:hypothetical protein n=1 Tax=Microseira wollei TaxID=467598 RepID=UPI001CFEC20D|nr:hypothetical protein [Microseira wollei]
MKIAIPTYGGHRRPPHKKLKLLWGGLIARHCSELIQMHRPCHKKLKLLWGGLIARHCSELIQMHLLKNIGNFI